jgi:hypothetical protein
VIVPVVAATVGVAVQSPYASLLLKYEVLVPPSFTMPVVPAGARSMPIKVSTEPAATLITNAYGAEPAFVTRMPSTNPRLPPAIWIRKIALADVLGATFPQTCYPLGVRLRRWANNASGSKFNRDRDIPA